jgi:hypothetical protein
MKATVGGKCHQNLSLRNIFVHEDGVTFPTLIRNGLISYVRRSIRLGPNLADDLAEGCTCNETQTPYMDGRCPSKEESYEPS